MKATFKVVGKPFVSKAPTARHFKLIEFSPTKIVFRVLNKTFDIPYCDTFGLEEEWLIAITTDHGGEFAYHGVWSEDCRKIFLILSGDGIKHGQIPPDCSV